MGYSEQEVRREIKTYLEKLADVPTVFIADNDFIACNAMQGMQELGYKIPEDISVIGFDDRPICQMMTPAVTTINVPKDAFGSSAVDILMEKMKRPRSYSVKMEIGTRLVERESVKQIGKSIDI